MQKNRNIALNYINLKVRLNNGEKVTNYAIKIKGALFHIYTKEMSSVTLHLSLVFPCWLPYWTAKQSIFKKYQMKLQHNDKPFDLFISLPLI